MNQVNQVMTALRTPALGVVNPVLFHELVMLVLEDFGGGLGVVEQLVDLLYLLPLHGLFPLNTAQQAGWCQQLYGVPEREMTATQFTDIYPLHLQCMPVYETEESKRSCRS